MPFSRPLSSEFLRNIAKVFSGTLIAQMIPILVAPILTRYFSPGDFGILEVFVSIATIVMTIITGRFELAVILPEKDEEAMSLIVASIALSFAFTLGLTVGLGIYRTELATLLSLPGIAPWLPLLPLFSFFGSTFFTLTYWFARKKRFTDLAVRKIIQNGATATVQIGGGLCALPGTFSLIGGAFFGYISGTALFFYRLLRLDIAVMRTVTPAAIASAVRRYREFPLLTLPSHILNMTATQLPSIILAMIFGGGIAGFYALTRRVLATPIQLAADSVSDVFRQRANADYLAHGTCRPIVTRTLLLLTALAAPPFLLLALFGPALFAVVFGEQWREAGVYAALLTPLFFFRFIASPLSYVLFIAERQLVNLVWQAALLIVTLLSFAAGAWMHSARWTLAFFSGSYAALYMVLIAAVWYYAQRDGVRENS